MTVTTSRINLDRTKMIANVIKLPIIILTDIITQNRLDKIIITNKIATSGDDIQIILTIQVIIKDEVLINQVNVGQVINLHNDEVAGGKDSNK